MFDKKILVEIFQGIVSLAILVFVIIIYFSTFYGAVPILGYSNIDKNCDSNYPNYQMYNKNLSHINQNYSEYSYVNQSKFNLPTEKVIILRMDDVQGYTWSEIVINLTDTVIRKNMSITLGVIPDRRVNNDTVIKKYLLEKIKDPRIEIAQHGTTHAENEFLNLSELDTYSLAKSGLEKMIDIFGIYPVTFIPPYNEYNKNITGALSTLGFKILSGKEKEYKFDGNMMYIGYDTLIKHSDQKELISIDKIIDDCSKSLEEKNICVIMIHPQDYVKEDRKTLDEDKYIKFVELLDELKKLDAKSITFRDLLK